MSRIVTFVPRRSREAELWDAYLVEINKMHDRLPHLEVSDMRRVVKAYDSFIEEFAKGRSTG